MAAAFCCQLGAGKMVAANDQLRDDWLEWRGRVDASLPHLATKADLQAAINALTWRLIAAMIAIAAVIVAILRLWPTQPS